MSGEAPKQKTIWTRPARLGAAFLLFFNLVMVAPLFRVEYSPYTGSIEGTFIAIARILVKYPGQWSWWPFWSGGIPFEDTYLPFSHWLTAIFEFLSGLSAARSFHIVTAVLYALGAMFLFWMLVDLSRKVALSFIAALAYSTVSLCVVFVPKIATDTRGFMGVRRLFDLVYYGESPHIIALTLLPLAVVFFHRTLTTPDAKWKILAGLMASLIALTNAFGIVMMLLALASLVLAWPSRQWWKQIAILAAIGAVSYCWISPWLSPNMIRALIKCAPASGGEYHYTLGSWITLAIMIGGFLAMWWAMRRYQIAQYLRFFAFLAWVPTWVMLAWYAFGITLIPQPARYEQEVDLALLLAVVFFGAEAVNRLRESTRKAVLWVAAGVLLIFTIHGPIYAWDLIRAVDPHTMGEYKMSHWLDQNRPGNRAFIAGSAAFLYNAFSDNPQVFGGHEQHTVNTFIPIVRFTVFSDMNAGDHGADYSILWLKAFGAHQVTVVGPESTSFWKPFAHPAKFDGVLPLLWRDGGDSIYEIPGRRSLAHVIPVSAVVARTPIHGLDTAPVDPFVAALDDPQYPDASFQWKSLSEAAIHATLSAGQVVSVQVTYDPGWRAWANGKPQKMRGDGLGQIVIDTDCTGSCDIKLEYTGGHERPLTRGLSLAAMLLTLIYWFRSRPVAVKPTA
jgi:hypothetical protein